MGEQPHDAQAPEFARALPRARAAVAYAQRLHDGQRRRDGEPFIEHPIEVASLLYSSGAQDDLVAAGVLHDGIEKAGASASDLRRRFGSRVATLVLAVTEDPRIKSYVSRKAALREQVARAGDKALMLFAADKTAAARELRRSGASAPARRLEHYRRSLRLLQEQLPHSPLTAALERELEAIRPPSADRRPAAG